MVKRAKFQFCMPDGSLAYEYRGHNYEVNPGLYTPTALQHRMAQERIDEDIKREKRWAEREANKPHRYEDTADYGFEMFWKNVEGELDEISWEEAFGESPKG